MEITSIHECHEYKHEAPKQIPGKSNAYDEGISIL